MKIRELHMYIPKKDLNDNPKIIIFSGAGLDAPSGIRTFRDTNGLWSEHKVEDICSQHSWKKNFNLVHKFYNERRKELRMVEPNYAHRTIKKLTDLYPNNVINITMNVSDLQERSGIECLHLHGELTKMECEACGNQWSIGYEVWNEEDICPKCSSKKGVRPHIVFFGGQAPMYTYLKRGFEHAENPKSIVVIIGTQGNVISIEDKLVHTKCKKILCNMEASPDINIEKCGFDKVYYESIETAIDKIYEDIKKWKEEL